MMCLFLLTDFMRRAYSGTITGHTVTNSVFNTAKGYQLTTLTLDSVSGDKQYTCSMNVNNVRSQAVVPADVIGMKLIITASN